MSVLDLITAIQAGDSQNIEKHFENEMSTRIAERLDDMRTNVAKNMFNEDTDEGYDYDLTLEDIEEFMQTEEYEQLDELSKKTLGSYISKAANNMAINHGYRMTKSAESDEVDRFMNRNTAVGYQQKHATTDDIKKTLGADNKSIGKLHHKVGVRARGIDTAVKKLTKEEVEDFMQTEEFEQLDELSKKTLLNYRDKAREDLPKQHKKSGTSETGAYFAKHDKIYADKSASDHDISAEEKARWEKMSARKGKEHETYTAKHKKAETRIKSRTAGIDRATKILTKEDVDQLAENKVPAGIKLFHHDKEGKESYSIHFSARDAQHEEKRRKKMGHKTVGHALVYGQNDEGERVNH